jgi:hypothetical protein
MHDASNEESHTRASNAFFSSLCFSPLPRLFESTGERVFLASSSVALSGLQGRNEEHGWEREGNFNVNGFREINHF